MCAIVDVNNCHKVFGEPSVRTPAGQYFFEWLEGESGRVVFGGTKFKTEIAGVGRYANWLATAYSKGRAYKLGDGVVDDEEQTLIASNTCQSNDEHLIALAKVGGARLLFTEDPKLHTDFGDSLIIANPRGKVYSTRIDYQVSPAHRQLLNVRNRDDMCAANCIYRS